jgi:hypothetical protein
MKTVIAKAKKRAREEGKETAFFHNGILMPIEKIHNFKKRKTIRESDLPSPGAGNRRTPSLMFGKC